MTKVHPDDDKAQLLPSHNHTNLKYCAYGSCLLILIGIILAIIFVPNPSGSKCGSHDLPTSGFVLHERDLSISSFRHNVDVVDPTTNEVVAEYYRKLISDKRTFRLTDSHDYIAASMVRESNEHGSAYSITACNQNGTWVIVQESFEVQNAQDIWEVQFTVRYTKSEDVADAEIIASSPRQAASANSITLTTPSGTSVASIVRGSEQFKDSSWTVTLHSGNIPQFVVGFFAVSVTDTAQYIHVDMSASPSPSPSVTPTISHSPSPSPSHNSASSLAFSPIVVLLSALMCLRWW